MCYNPILPLFILLHKLFQFSHWEPLRFDSCVLSTRPHPFLPPPNFLTPQDARYELILYFPCSSPETISPRSLYWRMVLGNQDEALRVLLLGHHCFQAHSVDTAGKHMCYTCAKPHPHTSMILGLPILYTVKTVSSY